MAFGALGANADSSQRYNASGEATEQARLPSKFQATPPPSSPLSDSMQIPSDHTSFVPGQPNAVVRRWPRMNGMRYLYASGMTRMPIQRLGADGTPVPWVSGFQPNSHGPIHNAGYNDALFQAGYPGFNLGLSFKVAQVDRVDTAAAKPWRKSGVKSARPQSFSVLRNRRPTGRPGTNQ